MSETDVEFDLASMEEVIVEEEQKEEVVEETPAEELQVEEALAEEEQTEEEEGEAIEEEETPVDIASVLAQQNAQIQQLTAAMQGFMLQSQAQKTPALAPNAIPEIKAEDAVPFIKDDRELAEFLSSPDKANILLNKILKMGEARGREAALVSMPDVVRSVVQQDTQRKQVVTSFYAANKDLIQHKDFVGYVAKEVAANNPNLDTPTMLKEVAKTVRARLGLKARVAASSKTGATNVVKGSFAGKKSAGAAPRPKPEVKSQAEQDLADLGLL